MNLHEMDRNTLASRRMRLVAIGRQQPMIATNDRSVTTGFRPGRAKAAVTAFVYALAARVQAAALNFGAAAATNSDPGRDWTL
ncbi:hypothetical protein HL667_25615 [Bradyrhizobium sp. 83012]|uniref:Uncharacterized protein n=1 Tax=Bradyrhizobium aeschynomenes TaxID=2734909 RepID=A0ABX2CJL7_9BRAD|nr:hypothetical protein [Bradyrhizobium aeschynomenes]NPU68404.1 hypothetical protein [Bradyrhizobium aeschynomenes]NPV25134.1 hypothetical protein [Bradyrhizobium aeschynomenes]